MRYIPEYFEFQNPTKIIAGNQALSSLPSEVQKLGVQKPLVITDQGIVKFGLLDKVKSALGNSKSLLDLVFDKVPPDSSIDIVNEATRLYKSNGCDGIIAIGGGSVIDTAKGINIMISEGTDNLLNLRGHDRLTKPHKPLIVIPTTSGTGSEVTLVAVVANPQTHEKMLFTSPFLQPALTVLDPEMTVSLPAHLTAATAMDAFTHALEAFSCLQKNPFSDSYAQVAIELVAENILKAVKNGQDKEARYRLALAGTAAGVAFSNSMVGAVHGIGHTVGAISHVHHGMAMAILLPHVMKYNIDQMADRYAPVWNWIYPEADGSHNETNEQKTLKVIQWIHELNLKLHQLTGMPNDLEKAGVKREQLHEIAHQSLNDGAMIANPKEIDENDAFNILNDAFKI